MAGNGRPIIPGQTAIETTFASGPLAQPSVVTLNGRDGIKLLTIGGLSKVEALAGQIAAGLVARDSGGFGYGSDGDREYAETVADRAALVAEAILAECNRRQAAAQEQANKPQIEGGLN